MSGLMIEVKSGPLRVRMHQEDCSNTPEYVRTMMTMATEHLQWLQEKTFAIDDVTEEDIVKATKDDSEKLSALAAAEADLEKRALDDDGEGQPA
jgi:hypothetical protein